ncbi:MAG: CHRD domain-containing protein [Rubrobacteridae bacterium]|nr:CHRD domain-containing protein [Rubrobacteridae bacterium]
MRKVALLLIAVLILGAGLVIPLAISDAAPPGTTMAKPKVVMTASAFLEPATGTTETARGTALLDYNPKTGWTSVTLLVKGLKANTSHAAHIHVYSCDGPVVYSLNNVVANEKGNGYSRTVIKSRINGMKWWVNVHRDPKLPSPGITCGKIDPIKYVQ